MAESIEINGREIAYRGLKRKEVKALKKEGFDLGRLDTEDVDEAMDRLFDTVLDPSDIEFLDDQVNRASYDVFKAVLAATYGDPAAEKN